MVWVICSGKQLLTVCSIVSTYFAKGGRAVSLACSPRRIAPNDFVDSFCRFRQRTGDIRRGWLDLFGPALSGGGRCSKWRTSPKLQGIFPKFIVVERAFTSYEKPTGVYKQLPLRGCKGGRNKFNKIVHLVSLKSYFIHFSCLISPEWQPVFEGRGLEQQT